VVADHFYQIPIYQQPDEGQIETDYIYKGANPLFREKLWMKIVPVAENSVRVEVLVPIEKADMGSVGGLEWELLGSDWKVEKFLLDRIAERVFAAPSPTGGG
jgi:hypothetical protein